MNNEAWLDYIVLVAVALGCLALVISYLRRELSCKSNAGHCCSSTPLCSSSSIVPNSQKNKPKAYDAGDL